MHAMILTEPWLCLQIVMSMLNTRFSRIAQLIFPQRDGAYDETPVYAAVIEHSPNADVVIPPRVNAVENDKSAPMRNRNIVEIKINDGKNLRRSCKSNLKKY